MLAEYDLVLEYELRVYELPARLAVPELPLTYVEPAAARPYLEAPDTLPPPPQAVEVLDEYLASRAYTGTIMAGLHGLYG